MNEQNSLEAIQDIKKMMERSSRFISLSGLSGVSAGVCALIGAWVAYPYVYGLKDLMMSGHSRDGWMLYASETDLIINSYLFWIAVCTLVAACFGAFFFTWIKSRKQQIPMWGTTAKRLLINMAVPLIAGGIFLFRLIHFGTFGLIAPGCLIFYGLSLINASKYTLEEIRYLGYCQILLGIINLFFVGYGLYFWAAGFGILHILYGFYMWKKYDGAKNVEEQSA